MKHLNRVALVLAAAACGCTQNGSTTTTTSGAKAQTAAPPPVRMRLVVPAGVQLPVEIQTGVSSETSREGDVVVAQLTDEVQCPGFKLMRGSEVRGAVTAAVPAKRVKGRARLAIHFTSVMKGEDRISFDTEPFDATAKSTKSKDTKIIAGSAIGGLILGALTDGKKGAAIGTAAGAAGGTGAVLIMKGDDVELPHGARLTLTVR